ncbi:MAG: sulfurtransferase TusA family protein [Rhodobacteraceae bacterium]|nr:sulfurtransferase TusA family protein [Paracoccaceae bacterium]
MSHDQDVDATGLRCPLPVLKARKRLSGMASGEVLRVEADDPVAVVDFPHFCAENGHDLLAVQEAGEIRVYLIRKGGAA